MENVRNSVKIEFFRKDDKEKILERPSKLTFNGIHNSFTGFDSYTSKQSEVFIDEPNYWGFAVLKLCNLSRYEMYHDGLQPYSSQDKLQLHWMVCNSFVLSIKILSITWKNLKTHLTTAIWIKNMNRSVIKKSCS